MAATTWTEDRTEHEPAGTWGSMPPNYGAGNEGNTWNIPAYDPDEAISTEYWQWQGRGLAVVSPFEE
jgi:hypothetical protein